MQHIRSTETEEMKSSESCTVTEYPFGDLTLLLPCSPAWTKEQYRHIP